MSSSSYRRHRFPAAVIQQADAETAQVTRLLARRRHDRQTAIIWRGIERTWDESSPHNRRSDQQPGREFASPDTAKRTTDAAIQICWFSTEIPFDTRRHLQYLQRPAPSHLTSNTTAVSCCGDGEMARGDSGCLNLGSRRSSATEPCLCDSIPTPMRCAESAPEKDYHAASAGACFVKRNPFLSVSSSKSNILKSQ